MEKSPLKHRNKSFSVRAETRYKNAALVNARGQLGLTIEAVAKQIGISPSLYWGLENMRRYPGEETQRKVCDFYRDKGTFLIEEDVFPEGLRGFAKSTLRKLVQEKAIDKEQLLFYSLPERDYLLLEDGRTEHQPEQVAEVQEVSEKIKQVLGELRPNQQEVINMRYFLGLALDEIADRMKLSRERVRQIEIAALHKL